VSKKKKKTDKDSIFYSIYNITPFNKTKFSLSSPELIFKIPKVQIGFKAQKGVRDHPDERVASSFTKILYTRECVCVCVCGGGGAQLLMNF
jgi:hypothetical protein